MAKNPYIGKIGHNGVRIVKVPAGETKKNTGKVRRGSALRDSGK